MNPLTDFFENHAFPTGLALYLLWLALNNYTKLAKRVTTLEATNHTLVTTYAQSFRKTMDDNNAVLANLHNALDNLQLTLSACPYLCPALDPKNAPGHDPSA